MAELWQSYGSWMFYGVAFVVMLLLHGRMHGGNARGATGEHGGHSHGEPGQSPKRGHRGCC